MKPRDNVFQGGGAATTDPRKPDYDNLYAMKRRRLERSDHRATGGAARQHPVEVMIDLVLENDDQVFVQPLVNETRSTCSACSGTRARWRPSPIRAPTSARRWARRCRRIS
jgi:hypothetical protein